MHTHVVILAFFALQAPLSNRPQPAPAHWLELLHESQADWTETALDAARHDLAANTAKVLQELVGALGDGTSVDGNALESTRYTVCGNALTLLEDLTHVRIDRQGRDWIGFRTHDHRSCTPSQDEIEAPWRAWLAVRKDLPVNTWFWGLSITEITPVLGLLSTSPANWKQAALEQARTLGPRLYPLLIEKILDEECSDGERVADRADSLLRQLTGKDAGKLERYEMLGYAPDDPMRALSTHLNRASLQLVQQNWLFLLTR